MALEADARHLFTDVWTSAGVVSACWPCMATGWLWLDPVIAIAVALNILREGGSLVWRSAEGLMDQALEPEVREPQIDQVLARLRHQTIRFDHVVTRRRPAPLRRPAHAHAGRLDAGPRGGGAHVGRAGADERGAGAAGQHPAAADGRRGALRRPQGPAVIALLQRVAEARVEVGRRGRRRHRPRPAGAGVRRAGRHRGQAAKLVDKLLKLRIFATRPAR
jgi:hypothetical protein